MKCIALNLFYGKKPYWYNVSNSNSPVYTCIISYARLIPVFLVEFDQKMFDMSIKTRAREMERFLRDPINFDSL